MPKIRRGAVLQQTSFAALHEAKNCPVKRISDQGKKRHPQVVPAGLSDRTPASSAKGDKRTFLFGALGDLRVVSVLPALHEFGILLPSSVQVRRWFYD